MAISDKLKKTSDITIPEKRFSDIKPTKPKTGPGVWQAAHQKAAVAQEELDKALAKIAVLENKAVKISDLHEVEGLKRSLTPEAYEELKANLSNNPLVHPIVVRPREKGGYDIISGHNRVAIFKELGRVEIEADIKNVSEEEVYETAFYANLFHSPLSDFEKFVRFKKIKEEHGLTAKELATRAGVSEAQISTLFDFDQLPEKCQKIIEANPHCIGYNIVSKVANTDEATLLSILKQLSAGEITQSQAVGLVSNKDKPPKEEPQVITIKVGKKKFADIKSRKGVVSVHLKDESYSEDVMRRIEAAIKDIVVSTRP
jgi:ParB family chromosome partitioning protein